MDKIWAKVICWLWRRNFDFARFLQTFALNSVLKSRFSIISAYGFRKRKKQRTNMARCSSPGENYYSSGRNTELKLCRLWSTYIGGDGFSTVNDHNASDSNLLFLCLLLSALMGSCSWLKPRANSRLRALQDYKVATLGIISKRKFRCLCRTFKVYRGILLGIVLQWLSLVL